MGASRREAPIGRVMGQARGVTGSGAGPLWGVRADDESASDTELVQASVSEPAAFDLLFARHAAPIRGWLLREVGDVGLANDLLAETFAQAWRSRRRFRGDDPHAGGAWLRGIARNLLHQHYRRGPVSTAARRRLGLGEHMPHDDDPDAILERLHAETLGAELEAALHELPAAQRRAIDARVVRDLSYDEVARELDCTPDNARARVSRGLRTLRSTLGGAQP